ncbi:Homeodomain-like DNA binding domain-containing transcription factor [Phycomyces blakesleeanus NRRL 1555(-)]|uniref:Homeodomain-like DNA binding domain-containing transcription factor n=1 Tax=Phycomyces blakesleeanus (strain ATCC 8743b / DSM 1359 / FGSC 10004 / NBRC 33097 / NRRL 1555) TaxID=763407 RepID=A0A162XQB6_PHYB8|nr:Homeodomain-like DNA binding domain-containing transcription factor [Phycomyces blakesleeanus NRRL 1555(-)]OAD76135.1 Homeodomain-like DNA binding domain-containing transcription factor [Phycomyces blakesleeanus NRRL 1555(-)]|eukprot:XP_018294175.1 Homeodomain-like DNA binding domain-containing transcription factor [Phycomyces blakesleeanus NRRL 1555(-)]
MLGLQYGFEYCLYPLTFSLSNFFKINPNQTAIIKRRKRNGPQKVLQIHIKNLIVEKRFIQESMTRAETARTFGVLWALTNNISDKFDIDGTVEPRKRGRSREENQHITDEHSKFISDVLKECCTLTLGQMRKELSRNFLVLQEFTLKRTKPVEKKGNDPKTIELRKAYIDSMHTNCVSYKMNRFFVDKADFNASLIRVQGWSKKGEASIVKTKIKRGLNIWILAGISYQVVKSL